jgi:hypothetical protein
VCIWCELLWSNEVVPVLSVMWDGPVLLLACVSGKPHSKDPRAQSNNDVLILW